VARRLLRRILPRSGRPAAVTPQARTGQRPAAEGPIAFQDLFRQLDAPDPTARQAAAMLVCALAPVTAIRPLVRAYVHHGDGFLLDALRVHGARLTLSAGREALQTARSPVERARLMDVLGASGDPAAATAARRALRDLEAVVRVSAAAALVELEQEDGAEALAQHLLSIHPEQRLLAVRAALRLDQPAARAVLEAHLGRYLALGGAVPRPISVSMPLLIDPRAELPGVIADQVRASGHALTVVIGPAAGDLAERRRAAFAALLPGYRLFFTTARHSAPEQFEALARARDAAAGGNARRVALIGEMPSPLGIHPPPHFLTRRAGERYGVHVVFVGQQEFAVVMEWWDYIDGRSEVAAEMSVVLTAHTLGAEDMTEEEQELLALAGAGRRAAFARALLAQRTV